jgi:Protein of unknown function (DUF533)
VAAIFATVVAWWSLGLRRLVFSHEAPIHARIEALDQFNRDTRLLVLDQAWWRAIRSACSGQSKRRSRASACLRTSSTGLVHFRNQNTADRRIRGAKHRHAAAARRDPFQSCHPGRAAVARPSPAARDDRRGQADGHIDAAEQANIFAEMDQLDLHADDKAFVMDELRAPLDVDSVAKAARTTEEAAEIYTASLLAVDVDNAAERGYLALVAARLRLDNKLVEHLHATVEGAAEKV